MSALRYVPMLKGKQGEYAALEVLAGEIKRVIQPLIEIPAVPYDYVNERATRSLEEHLDAVPVQLEKVLPGFPAGVFLDAAEFEGETTADGQLAVTYLLNRCRTLRVVPVLSTRTTPEAATEVLEFARAARNGIAVRLVPADFSDDVDLNQILRSLLASGGGIAPENVDLVVDFASLRNEEAHDTLIARAMLNALPQMSWRTVVLSASSFPQDLSEMDASAITRIPRREWSLWRMLMKRRDRIPSFKNLVFGDYAIAHPRINELDPRTMRMSASIRYTVSDAWIVLKGRNVRQHGYEQYFALAQQLTEHEEFFGADYSWGDQYVFDCARRTKGSGNATTWRKIGTNHHITLVAKSLLAGDDAR